MHFYPGVAEYREPGRDPYRVFLNEDTIRAMDPTFAGRPVFVMHVDGVDESVDALRGVADGWVTESFYNQADGKHWVKFLVVSERGERAIKNGYKLSNCYVAKRTSDGGTWNGVTYEKEVTDGEYEHLALVPDPRYAESVILTPEEFKDYNEEKIVELKRLANREDGVKLKLFKRQKVENSVDMEEMSVQLPKSGRELTLTQLVNEADEAEQKKKEPQMANGEHHVEVGGSKMTVNDLVKKYADMCNELEALKAKKDGDEDEEPKEKNEDDDDHAEVPASVSGGNSADDESEEDREAALKEAKDAEDKKKNELEAARAKKAAAKAKADRLRNAGDDEPEVVRVDLSEDRVARGKARYGSN